MICGSSANEFRIKRIQKVKDSRRHLEGAWKLCTRKGICRMSGQRRFLKLWARTVGMPVGINDEDKLLIAPSTNRCL